MSKITTIKEIPKEGLTLTMEGATVKVEPFDVEGQREWRTSIDSMPGAHADFADENIVSFINYLVNVGYTLNL